MEEIKAEEVSKTAEISKSTLNVLLVCEICRKPLTEDNRARREDGTFRDDALGRPWCQSCTDKHDNIDWDEVYNKTH